MLSMPSEDDLAWHIALVLLDAISVFAEADPDDPDQADDKDRSADMSTIPSRA
jgi:hypothetical protein